MPSAIRSMRWRSPSCSSRLHHAFADIADREPEPEQWWPDPALGWLLPGRDIMEPDLGEPGRFVYGNPLEEEALLATGDWQKVSTIASRRSQWPYGYTCVYERNADKAGSDVR